MKALLVSLFATVACANVGETARVYERSKSCDETPVQHISEAEIQKLSPESKLNLMVLEQMYHVYDVNDENLKWLHRFLIQDGIKIVPTATKYLEEYDPNSLCKRRQEAQLLTATIYVTAVDSAKVKLRSNDIGKNSIASLEKAIERRRSSQKDDDRDTIFDISLEQLKGRSIKDGLIQHTLKTKFGLKISDEELGKFVEYLISIDPEYPSWTRVVGWAEMSEAEADKYFQAYFEYSGRKHLF